MVDFVTNVIINYIWYPISWIVSLTTTLPVMYVCPEQPCTINQMFISPDECIILQTVDGKNNRIKGTCTKNEDKITITENDKTYTWSYKEDGKILVLYDEQTKTTIKLLKTSKDK